MRFKSSTTLDRGFTLIELLIVVAIIAILAAIAVPNFLEAQTRAKVSRAKSDMRTVGVALESYFVDANQYPPKKGPRPAGLPNVAGAVLGSWVPQWPDLDGASITTPIAYLTSVPSDVFAIGSPDLKTFPTNHPVYGFRYTRIVARDNSAIPTHLQAGGGGSDLSGTAVFGTSTRIARYGMWFMLSNGPDKDADIFGFTNQYDPTNGTVSNGDILYSQKNGFGGDRL